MPTPLTELPPKSHRGRSPHRRDTASMHRAPRCGARTRRGSACRAPAVAGRRRCRMHGGARGSGARPGNRNAWKHGADAAAELARVRALRRMIREMEDFLAALLPRPARWSARPYAPRLPDTRERYRSTVYGVVPEIL